MHVRHIGKFRQRLLRAHRVEGPLLETHDESHIYAPTRRRVLHIPHGRRSQVAPGPQQERRSSQGVEQSGQD